MQEIAQLAADLLAEKTAAASERWLNVDQAAEHLAMSTSQLYSLCSARRTSAIPVHKEGSRSYFKASELDARRQSR